MGRTKAQVRPCQGQSETSLASDFLCLEPDDESLQKTLIYLAMEAKVCGFVGRGGVTFGFVSISFRIA